MAFLSLRCFSLLFVGLIICLSLTWHASFIWRIAFPDNAAFNREYFSINEIGEITVAEQNRNAPVAVFNGWKEQAGIFLRRSLLATRSHRRKIYDRADKDEKDKDRKEILFLLHRIIKMLLELQDSYDNDIDEEMSLTDEENHIADKEISLANDEIPTTDEDVRFSEEEEVVQNTLKLEPMDVKFWKRLFSISEETALTSLMRTEGYSWDEIDLFLKNMFHPDDPQRLSDEYSEEEAVHLQLGTDLTTIRGEEDISVDENPSSGSDLHGKSILLDAKAEPDCVGDVDANGIRGSLMRGNDECDKMVDSLFKFHINLFTIVVVIVALISVYMGGVVYKRRRVCFRFFLRQFRRNDHALYEARD